MLKTGPFFKCFDPGLDLVSLPCNGHQLGQKGVVVDCLDEIFDEMIEDNKAVV